MNSTRYAERMLQYFDGLCFKNNSIAFVYGILVGFSVVYFDNLFQSSNFLWVELGFFPMSGIVIRIDMLLIYHGTHNHFASVSIYLNLTYRDPITLITSNA